MNDGEAVFPYRDYVIWNLKKIRKPEQLTNILEV